MTLTIGFLGIIAIAVLGFVSRRRPAPNLSEWTVAGRQFGTFTMWLLQAGEIYTTFTFLALSGLVFVGGAAAFYAIPYVPLAFVILYFLGPRVWKIGKERGYLTQADFFEDRFKSRPLATVVAVLGVIFLIPYLQLQVTGLGAIVEIATGNKTSSTVSMVIAFLLTIGFVLWAGIKGTAFTSYLKDALMIIVLIVLAIAIPSHYAGSIGGLFTLLKHKMPAVLTVHAGAFGPLWFLSSMFISTTGAFLTLPHNWPPLFSAKSAEVLRRNYTYLPLYQIGIVLPMVVGFTALAVLPAGTASNGILLTLTAKALPSWVLGLTVAAGVATAMVPSAGLLVGITSTVARNIVRSKTDKQQYTVNQITVVIATLVALYFAIAAPTLLADLLLLTFAGLAQLAPGVLAGAWMEKWRPNANNLLAGILLGEVIVAYLSLANVYVGGINVGVIGLGANLLLVVVLEAIGRSMRRPTPAEVGKTA